MTNILSDTRKDLLSKVDELNVSESVKESSKNIAKEIETLTDSLRSVKDNIESIENGMKNMSGDGILQAIAGVETIVNSYTKSIDDINTHLLALDEFPGIVREVSRTISNVHENINKNIEEIRGSTNLFLYTDVQLNMKIIENSISEL
jgi:methyl-accepting chemotaxis protein